MIYFDYTATTPIDEEVLETYIRIQKKFFANTTSLHKLGQESNYMYEKATSELKEILNLKNHNIVYTSNATEANNLAIFGTVSSKKGKVITTKIEHPSVYEVYRNLDNSGYDVVFLNVDSEGRIDPNELNRVMDTNTILVSIMWVNNIIGSIQPIKEVIQIVKQYPKAKLHVDMVQGMCKIVPDFNFEDIDVLTLSIHKIYGPKGIGIMAFRNTMEMAKRLYGSSSQFGLKPGTIDLALIVAACKTIKKYFPDTAKHYEYVKTINLYLREKIEKLDFIVVNSTKNASPYIINISIPDSNGETLVHMLEAKEIFVSTGSSCSSKLKKPEKTILSVTNSEALATSSIRISLSHLSTYHEIDSLVEVLEKVKNV